MTDTVKPWIEERQAIRSYTTEAWEHDRHEDGGNFWAGGGRSDFHLTVDDAAFCVDAHRNLPRAVDALNAVLAVHEPVDKSEWTVVYDNGKPHEKPKRIEYRREWKECTECTRLVNDLAEWAHEMQSVEWPCATVQAIEGAING